MRLSLFWTLLSFFAFDVFGSAAHRYVVEAEAAENCTFA